VCTLHTLRVDQKLFHAVDFVKSCNRKGQACDGSPFACVRKLEREVLIVALWVKRCEGTTLGVRRVDALGGIKGGWVVSFGRSSDEKEDSV
jgi:hypothetical protein